MSPLTLSISSLGRRSMPSAAARWAVGDQRFAARNLRVAFWTYQVRHGPRSGLGLGLYPRCCCEVPKSNSVLVPLPS